MDPTCATYVIWDIVSLAQIWAQTVFLWEVVKVKFSFYILACPVVECADCAKCAECDENDVCYYCQEGAYLDKSYNPPENGITAACLRKFFS